MEKYGRAQVVWAKAEKSAQGGYKERPVVILASWPCDGALDYLVVICSISRLGDPFRFGFSNADFKEGGFPEGDDQGWIRPSYATVVKAADVTDVVGTLSDAALERILAVLRKLVG